MRSLLFFLPRALWALALGAGLGCYNPNIGEGEFACGPANICPSGFSCSGGRCYRSPPVGDGSAKDTASCVGPIQCAAAASTTKPGVCDLACQSGCACNDRCVLKASGPTCAPPAAEAKGPNEACDTKQDNCRPGSMCLPLGTESACGARCFRFCNKDQDCGSDARCTNLAGVGSAEALVCSNPIENCNPASKRARCTGALKDDANFGCYVLSASTFPDLATCECAGTKEEGKPCDGEHDCKPGLECWQPPGTPAHLCVSVCPLGGPGSGALACPIGATCRPFTGPGDAKSKVWGYCF